MALGNIPGPSVLDDTEAVSREVIFKKDVGGSEIIALGVTELSNGERVVNQLSQAELQVIAAGVANVTGAGVLEFLKQAWLAAANKTPDLQP